VQWKRLYPSQYIKDLIAKDLSSRAVVGAGDSSEPKRDYVLDADETEQIDPDGTIRRFKKGKLWAWKTAGGIWTVKRVS
jgi:hypothetical protein